MAGRTASPTITAIRLFLHTAIQTERRKDQINGFAYNFLPNSKTSIGVPSPEGDTEAAKEPAVDILQPAAISQKRGGQVLCSPETKEADKGPLVVLSRKSVYQPLFWVDWQCVLPRCGSD